MLRSRLLNVDNDPTKQHNTHVSSWWADKKEIPLAPAIDQSRRSSPTKIRA
uniref:Uncharacterized protein n=1 Tax=Arundo donax TaxID=35708 RepID=A0A0A8YCN7_ARUDO